MAALKVSLADCGVIMTISVGSAFRSESNFFHWWYTIKVIKTDHKTTESRISFSKIRIGNGRVRFGGLIRRDAIYFYEILFTFFYRFADENLADDAGIDVGIFRTREQAGSLFQSKF